MGRRFTSKSKTLKEGGVRLIEIEIEVAVPGVEVVAIIVGRLAILQEFAQIIEKMKRDLGQGPSKRRNAAEEKRNKKSDTLALLHHRAQKVLNLHLRKTGDVKEI